MTLYEAVSFVVEHGNPYAVSYAKVAQMNWDAMSDNEFITQMLYIQTNISNMRAPGSKEVRQVIKEFTKNN